MPQTYFILDSTHADYAGVLSALGTTTAAKYGGSYSQVVHTLVAPYSTDYRLVKANIEDSERTGSLAPVATDQMGTGVFVEELGRDDVLYNRDARMDILQLSGRRREVIRPEDAGPYNNDDGTTFKDARSGFGDTGMGSELQPGTTLDVVDGTHIKTRNGEAFNSLNDSIPFPSGDADRPIIVRHDHPVSPAFVSSGFFEKSGGEVWRPDGESNAWYRENMIQLNSGDFGWTVAPPASGILDATSKWPESYFLKKVDSIEELRRTPGSHFAENIFKPTTPYDGRGSTGGNSRMWVHLKDGSDPTGRVVTLSGLGWAMKVSATPRKVGIEFHNMNYLGSPGIGTTVPQIKVRGGRWLFGSMKPTGDIKSGIEFGSSLTGKIQFDVKDRPSRIDTDILTLARHHGVSADEMDMSTWLETSFSKQGVYWFGGGIADKEGPVRYDGILFRDIGEKVREQPNQDGDSHAIAGQGMSNIWARRFAILRAGSAVNQYAIANGGSQNGQNLVFEKFIIRDNHNYATGAGTNGININGDSDAGPRTDGSGDRSGCIIRLGVIGNIANREGNTAGDFDYAGVALNIDQELQLLDCTLRDCWNGIEGARGFTTDSSYVTNPGILAGAMKIRRCRFVLPLQYAIWTRGTNWNSTSPPNVGYFDSDDNEYIIPAGDDPALAELWRIISTAHVLTSWRSTVKASPPAAVAEVHDDNSTVTAGGI